MGDVLYRLTGALLYEDPAMWQRWWREHGEHFELAPTAPPAPGHGRGGTEAAFYGIGVRSNRVCFVIDQSGSMGSAAGPRAKGKTRFDVARDQVNHALRAFGAEDRANLMLFTSDPRPWRGGLQPMTRSNRRRLTSFLRARRPEGGTNLYDAVARALVQPNVDTLFVLSDGQPVQGSYVKPEDILREIRRLNVTRRVAIHCIAVGHDSPLLRQLAAENEGQYVRH